MVNSYSGPLTYGQGAMPVSYEGMESQVRPSFPVVTVSTLAAGGISAYMGYRKNPYIAKNGNVADSFAKKAYEIYVKKVPDAGKDAYNQSLEILKKIDKIKNPEDLKGLLSSNPLAAKHVCVELGDTAENFADNITKENLSANKKIIKEKLKAGNNTRYQNMKNWIQACWDKDKKKFVKQEGMQKEICNSIRKAAYGGKSRIIAKYAAISAAAAGIVTYIGKKLLTARSNMAQLAPQDMQQPDMQGYPQDISQQQML